MRQTLGVPAYFTSSVHHMQRATPQTYNKGSVFFQVRALIFLLRNVLMMKYMFFLSSEITVFMIFFWDMHIFLLHILFLEPLHSLRDRNPKQHTCSQRLTYNLRLSFYDSIVKKMLWFIFTRLTGEPLERSWHRRSCRSNHPWRLCIVAGKIVSKPSRWGFQI